MRAFVRFSFVLALAGCSVPVDQSASTASLAGAAPLAVLTFAPGWQQQQHGAIVAGGQLRVDYALARLGACRGDGWRVDAFALFDPGERVVSASVGDGPALFDVPADATAVQLWFHDVSPGCEAWDSRYGANYGYRVEPRATAPIGWLGGVGGDTERSCQHQDTLADPIVIDEYMRERACIFADVDVWAGGVTDGATPHPEYVMAEVEWHTDANAAVDEWLDDVGRTGNNERFRWQVPYELRNMADWTTATFALRVSVDGRNWSYAEGGRTRTLQRAFMLPSP